MRPAHSQNYAIVSSGAHGNNLIAVLAKYIYHKHDPALPRLAIQLLKRLATVRASRTVQISRMLALGFHLFLLLPDEIAILVISDFYFICGPVLGSTWWGVATFNLMPGWRVTSHGS